MKTKFLTINGLALAAVLALGACTTSRYAQSGFVDDLYDGNGKAKEVTYRSPDYYADEQPVADEQYTDEYGNDTVYDDSAYSDTDVYADDYYADEYSDSEYANRINRFYYSSPGMTYYDPMFDPWYSPGLSFGLGWGGGWGNSWSLGWGSSFYNPYYAGGWGMGWNYPYYGNSFWGPYSYYGGGYGGYGGYYNPWGWGGGYYPGGIVHTRTQRTRGSYDTRSSRAGVSSRPSTDRSGRTSMAIGRDRNGRIVTSARSGGSREGTSVRTREVMRPGSSTVRRPTSSSVRTRGTGSVRPVSGASRPGTQARPARQPRGGSGQQVTRPATSERGTSRPASVSPPSRSSGSSGGMSSGGGSSRSSGGSSGGGGGGRSARGR